MKIDLHKIPVREVIEDYKDSAEEGVVAYGSRLDIRPKYQREFVYKEKQRNAVIETFIKSPVLPPGFLFPIFSGSALPCI